MTLLKSIGIVWALIVFVILVVATMYLSYIIAIGLLIVLLVFIINYFIKIFDK